MIDVRIVRSLFLALIILFTTGNVLSEAEGVAPASEKSSENNPSMAEHKISTMLFAGDTHFMWGIVDTAERFGSSAVVAKIAPVFKAADFVGINFETAMAQSGSLQADKHYIFNSDRKYISILKSLKVNLAMLGNNHSMDMGSEGLDQTRQFLAENSIATVGSGNNEDEASNPVVGQIENVKYAIFSISEIGADEIFATATRPGTARSGRALYEAIAKAKRENDLVIVSVHWGREYRREATTEQRSLARRLIGAGADVIIGHHPHIFQGIEMINGGVVFYSLGNFIFGSVNQFQEDNIIVRLKIDQQSRRIANYNIIPVTGAYRNIGHIIEIPDQQRSRKVFGELAILSEKLNGRPMAMTLLEDGSADLVIKRGK